MRDKKAYIYKINKHTRLIVARHELLTSVAWPAFLPSKYMIDLHQRIKPQQKNVELFHKNIEY